MNPSALIDKEIADHPDWRGQTMAEVRRVIRETVPDVTEEWKWMGTPTWSKGGILCICNAFKNMVKVTFINGAKLEDPDHVFNAELTGNKWRAIKLYEGDVVNARGLKKILLAAVALNASKGSSKTKAKPTSKATTTKAKPTSKATPSTTKATTTKAPRRAAPSAAKAQAAAKTPR